MAKHKLPSKVRGVAKGSGLWYTIARKIFRPILEEIEAMSAATQAAIDDMRAAVEASTTVTQSAVTLIQNLASQIEDAADDPDEIRALAQTVRANAASLASAVPANTPADTGASDTGSSDTPAPSGDTGDGEPA